MAGSEMIKKLNLKPQQTAAILDALSAAGLRPVAQVAIDDMWSALRFRPNAKVGS